MKPIFFASLVATALAASEAAQAQVEQVVNSSGGTASQNNLSVDWSIGELALVNVMESPDSRFMLTNGFLQPNNHVIYRREKSYFQPFDLRLYPNPTKDILALDFFTVQKGQVAIFIYSDAGKLVHQDQFAYDGNGESYEVHLKNYPAGVYSVYVYLDPYEGQVRKTGSYRVIKINN